MDEVGIVPRAARRLSESRVHLIDFVDRLCKSDWQATAAAQASNRNSNGVQLIAKNLVNDKS